jgi:CDP-diacylglycerol--glycerol-3-phosphate 3-phosphatidyltransferase
VVKVVKSLPNIITGFRIIGTAVLAFVKPFSAVFYLIYTLSGLSDILDGYVARKYRLESKLGSVLDSIADILFYTVMLLRIYPVLADVLPAWLWIAVGCVLVIRLCSYVVAAIKYQKFAALHTYLNKATGVAVFFVPYIIKTQLAVAFCAVVCFVAICASAQELYTHVSRAEYIGR